VRSRRRGISFQFRWSSFGLMGARVVRNRGSQLAPWHPGEVVCAKILIAEVESEETGHSKVRSEYEDVLWP
jgi:hypothetical protein